RVLAQARFANERAFGERRIGPALGFVGSREELTIVGELVDVVGGGNRGSKNLVRHRFRPFQRTVRGWNGRMRLAYTLCHMRPSVATAVDHRQSYYCYASKYLLPIVYIKRIDNRSLKTDAQ